MRRKRSNRDGRRIIKRRGITTGEKRSREGKEE